jgi:hypothetical protein
LKIHDHLPASRKERGQIPQPQPDDRREEVRTVLDAERLDATRTASLVT